MYKFTPVLLILALLGMSSVVTASRPWRLHELRAPAADPSGNAYGIVIDAGSTGSRLHVYRWNATHAGGSLPRNLSLAVELVGDTFQVSPGISDPAGLKLIDTIITKAQTELAGMQLSDIPIFLKATAGMRLLPSSKRDEIMGQVRAKLSASGFQWLCDSQARVISGEEEGVFGWITVNYIAGRLKQGEIHNLDDTVGALDLGGASTQITLKPSDPDILANLFALGLGQQVEEDLYTHSFLHFGENEALRRATAAIVAETPDPSKGITSPCYLSGYSFTYQDLATGQEISVNGSSEYFLCRALMEDLLFKNATCLTDPNPPPVAKPGATCSIAGVYQPSLQGSSFLAFSGFSYIYEFLNLDLNHSTPAALQAAATAFCSSTWKEAQKDHPEEPIAYLATFCASSTFAHALLTTGYGFAADSTQVQVAPSSSNTDWALGSMLYDANQAWRLR